MKRIHKSLIFSSAAIMGICPTMSILSGCSHLTYDQLINNLKNDVLSEFSWICKFYRETFHNREFCHELYKRITNMGFKVVREWNEELNCPLPRIDSKGVEHYHPSDDTCFGYNMYFDIESNISEEVPIIALQAHTDMVVSVNPNVKHYDWSQGVIQEFDGDLIHSKNNATTLGADDGGGLSTILALAKHKNDFRHGKIRCILTVDEENGDSGAKFLPVEWLKDVTYFMSIDGEQSNQIWVASAGSAQSSILITDVAQTHPQDFKQFSIEISGFPGAHSGLEIMDNHMNAIVLMGEVLQTLIKDTANFTNVRLVQCYENGKKDKSTSCSSVPTSINFIVETTTNKTFKDVKQIVTDRVNQSHSEFQQDNPDEKPVIQVEQVSTVLEGGISTTLTNNVAEVLSNYSFQDGGYKLYGYEKYPESVHPNTTLTGCNVGAIRVGDSISGENKIYIEIYGRSHDTEELKKYSDGGDGEYVKKIIAALIKKSGTEEFDHLFHEIFVDGPWVLKENNKLEALVHEAASKIGHPLTTRMSLGWQEISEFYQKNPDIHYVVIGPQIDHAHSPMEQIHISTIVPLIKIILYTIENLNTLK